MVQFGYCVSFLNTGDVNSISVGSGTNIQDNSLVHVAKSNLSGKVLPTIIGNNVTIGKQIKLSPFDILKSVFYFVPFWIQSRNTV